MKLQKKLLLSVVLLLLTLLGVSFHGRTVLAAAKPTLNVKELVVPIGKMNEKVFCEKDKDGYLSLDPNIFVENKKKGATYEFTSSNTKIVTISKKGGYLTALKTGSTTIVCKETYNKKTTVIGKCKVTVKKSKVISYDYNKDFAIGSGILGVEVFDDGYYNVSLPFYIEYLNPQATYQFKTDSKDFKFEIAKLTKEEKKIYTPTDQFAIRYTAKKPGTYKVTVTETYKGKTTTVGSFKIKVHDTEVRKTYELPVNSSTKVFNLISYDVENQNYYFLISTFDSENMDNNVIVLNKEDGYLEVRGLKVGTATLKIYEGKDDSGRYLGSCNIKVVEIPAESIEAEASEITTYVGDDYFYVYFYLDPYNTTDKLELTSSDPSVLKVEKNEYGYWEYTPLSEGRAVITAKAGKVTASTVVNVVKYE